MVVMGIFSASAVIGFIFFTIYEPTNRGQEKVKIGEIQIWGTVDSSIMENMLNKLKNLNSDYKGVYYVQKDKDNFKIDLLEAIASGNSPDLFLISQSTLFENQNKISKIPYSYMSARYFKDTYLDVFSIFDSKDGFYAMPFMVDPMVMYYNKTMFNSAGIALPPKEWKDFVKMAPSLTKKESDGTILKSATAFGETINVANLKQIISTFLLQTGNQIVTYDKDGKLVSDKSFSGKGKSVAGLIFFNEFSNQLSKIYSWNRTLPNSKDYFIAGNLATYFGFVSEIANLQKKNPNLNFDVAEIPSTSETFDKTVFANVWGFAILKNSQNKMGAYKTAQHLSGPEIQKSLSKLTYLPSVRKDLSAETADDPYMDIFKKEAIYAKTWVDPSEEQTNQIFKYMVNSIKSGNQSPSGALSEAYQEIEYLLNN